MSEDEVKKYKKLYQDLLMMIAVDPQAAERHKLETMEEVIEAGTNAFNALSEKYKSLLAINQIAVEALQRCTNVHLMDGRFIDVAEEALTKIAQLKGGG